MGASLLLEGRHVLYRSCLSFSICAQSEKAVLDGVVYVRWLPFFVFYDHYLK